VILEKVGSVKMADSLPVIEWKNLLENLELLKELALMKNLQPQERRLVFAILESIVDCSQKRRENIDDERELNIIYNRLLGSLLVLRSLIYEK
jgi:hypothetical protein